MRHLMCLTAVLALLFGVSMAATAGEPAVVTHRVYSHLVEPKEHPDYTRRHVKPPDWSTFGNRTQFTSLRGFGIDKGRLTGYAEEMEKYTRTFGLGDVLWPHYPMVFTGNLGDFADEVKRRGLFLFDIWGYVPGSGPGDWTQFKVPRGVFELFEEKLGDHWLGMDIGEQDGRYIGGYAPVTYPVSTNRFEQYLNFQRHFERMGDELGNRLSTLVSLNFGHYFLKEGTYTLIGAETAQALPSSQVYYAFIRGAGKQYGVPWFGNASVFNRWGYKSYGGESAECGPTKGTSLSLMKRLIYSHILYNGVFVGFESGLLACDGLSPIGRIQQAAQQWVIANGQPGVQHTPVALMTDFDAGWTFPRHLYTPEIYRVWGNVPYGAGDYLTDGVLDMLFPGYQDASYFHDESGFIAPTPYGDIADCVLSDAPSWMLARYPVLVVAGELRNSAETWDKLARYAEEGGCLVLTAGNLSRREAALAGVTADSKAVAFASGAKVRVGDARVVEEHPFALCPLTLPKGAKVLAKCGRAVAAAEVPVGRGRLIVLATPFGVPSSRTGDGPIANSVDKPLAKPFPLLAHVRALLDKVFLDQRLFDVGDGLSLVTCRKGPGEYTLGICNNGWKERPFAIKSLCGPVESVTELAMDQSEKRAVGYLPAGYEGAAVGSGGGATIAGGDTRVFLVKVREQGVAEIAHVAPPARPHGRVLPLRGARSIKEEILARPTFFEHYDGVWVDWRYVHDRDTAALHAESGWIARQGLRVFVDLTPGLNLFPDLRLIENDEEPYAASMKAMEETMAKMETLGSHDLLLGLHRVPENNFTGKQTWDSFEKTLGVLCATAAKHGITLHLRTGSRDGTPLEPVVSLAARVNAPNLKLAPVCALLLHQKASAEKAAAMLKDKVGLWVAGSPAYDVSGRLWSLNAVVAGEAAANAALIGIAPDAPVLFDAVYENQDAEYADACALERAAAR